MATLNAYKIFKNFQKRRRKKKKKKLSFSSSNAITTIFGLEKLQSLLISAVKNFSKKTILSKDIVHERRLGRLFQRYLVSQQNSKRRGLRMKSNNLNYQESCDKWNVQRLMAFPSRANFIC